MKEPCLLRNAFQGGKSRFQYFPVSTSVLLRQYLSISLKVLQYSLGSTGWMKDDGACLMEREAYS